MSLKIINFTYVNEHIMQKRIDTVNNSLRFGIPYLREIISPRLEKVADSEHNLHSLYELAKGSYLIHSPEIQSYTVVKHYFIPDKGNLYVIAVSKNELYGFLISANGWAVSGCFDKAGFKQYLCKSSECIGKTIGNIADQYGTPPAEILHEFYV